jgi:hypothetical protein
LPESSVEDEEKSLQLSTEEEFDGEETLDTLDKIERALPQVTGLDSADKELDEIAEMAVSSYRDLMELGMNVEPKHGPEIFNSAGTFLGHAITAKTAKVNKKLKMLDLQMKKAQLDVKMAAKIEQVDNTPVGEGKTLDRNELLKMLANKTDGDSS